MKPERLHTRKYLEDKRRSLRSQATPAERFLWKHLKNKQLDGLRWQRQHSIGNYIVDFYCASAKIIVELDGAYHDLPHIIEKDKLRNDYLESLGFTVLRFENKMAFENLESIFGWIRDAVKKKE